VNKTATRRTAAKLAGSLGVVAVAAAVAGIGTFGTFTDSTEAMAADIGSGVVSIDLARAAQVIDMPHVDGGWIAGDSAAMPIDLVNNGTAALSSVTVGVTAVQSSLLDTDKDNGLQMTIQSCSQAWEATPALTYRCAGAVAQSYAGPAVLSQTLKGSAALAAGGVDHLLVTTSLPKTAGNEFQGAVTTLSGIFTGIQRDGAAR
jgi:hypothetical protein